MEVLITYFLKYLLAPFLVAAILLMMNGIKAIKKQLKFKMMKMKRIMKSKLFVQKISV